MRVLRVLEVCLRVARLAAVGTVLVFGSTALDASGLEGSGSHLHSGGAFCLFADADGLLPSSRAGGAAWELSGSGGGGGGGGGFGAVAGEASQGSGGTGEYLPEPYYPWQDGASELAPLRFRLTNDIRDLLRVPGQMERRQWRLVGGAVLLVGAVSLLDEQIRDVVYTGSGGSEELGRMVRPIGQEGALAFLGASWVLGKSMHRPKFTAIATDGLEATILSAGLVTPLLKNVTGRARPRAGEGASSFSGGESFPSGEVTQAFAIASVVAAHAERKWVRGLAWSLAGVTAWQRMALDGHWGSEVLVGAMIGASLGRWVVRRNRPGLRESRRGSWSPQIGGGSYGLSYRLALGAER